MGSSNAHDRRPWQSITRRQCIQIGALSTWATAARATLTAPAIGADERGAMRIWDNHCHLDNLSGRTPAQRTAQLIQFADRMHIDRLVLFMGWPFSYDPSPEELRRQNDQVLDAMRGWQHRVLAYAYVNPNHVDASLEEMRRCIANGPMVGVKLWVAKKCSHESLDPIVQLASQLQAAVYQHTWIKTTGNLPGESTPEDIAKLASRHPQTPLICGHAGGNWELGIRTIRPHKNVYLETAGGDPTAGLVEMAVRELGPERVIYGSDAGGRSFASQLAKILGAEIPERQKELILGGNLRRLLTPILETKS